MFEEGFSLSNRVTVLEASGILEVSQQYIRIGLQKGALPIGTAVQISGKKWTYHISRALLNKYIGKENESEAGPNQGIQE